MADPFPVGSTPGAYATYPGRVVPGSIPDRVAPDLESAYHRLAPDPDVFYGTFLPVAFNRPGSARWMREGMNFRWSLPAIVRDGLLGALDLANGTHTGEVTPRAAQTFAFGLPMAGFGLAERGALGAAGARPAIPSLPLDEAARYSRAREQGFRPELTLYHATAGDDFPAFSRTPPATMLGLPPVGTWTARNPEFAARFPARVNQLTGAPIPASGQPGWRILPLIPRWSRLASIEQPPGPMDPFAIHGAVVDAWDAGFDAVRFLKSTANPGAVLHDTYVFKNPNQLRSRFARFDPAKSDSDDLLAGSAVPVPLAVPAPAPEQRTPGFRGPPSLAESLAYWRFMNEPKVY
jgi:hypothetical protein